MVRNIYESYSSYDWVVLWRIFLSVGISFTAFFYICYYMNVKWLFKDWDVYSRRITLSLFTVTSMYFTFSLVWALGLFDPLELTNYTQKPHPVKVLLLALVAGIVLSIFCWLTVKGWENLIKEHEYHPIAQKRRKKRMNKYSELIRRERIKLGLPTNEEEVAREAEEMSIRRALFATRIIIGSLSTLCLIFFSPYVLGILLSLI